MKLSLEQRDRLVSDGWRESDKPFWRDEPCFYDLSLTKTVVLMRAVNGQVCEAHFFWKYDWQELPHYIESSSVEVRRYKLHHSMNALLWHDYGDRKIVH